MKLSFAESDLETYSLFLEESRDHLETMERKILALGDGTEPDAVNEIFRALHSIKGVASFLGLSDIQKLSHRMESVFDMIRLQRVAMDEGLLRICLEGLDRLQFMLALLQESLDGRVKDRELGWNIELAEVDYHEVFLALERVLAAIDSSPTSSRATPAPQASPRSPAPEASLITPEMALAFVKEGEEVLDSVEQIFLKLAEDPSDAASLAEAFRGIHSFKGNSGFFGYAEMEGLSHRLESLLQPIRDAGAPAPGPVVEATLKSLDALRKAVAGLGSGQGPDVAEYPALCAGLDRLLAGDGSDPADAVSDSGTARPDTVSSGPERLGEILIREGQATVAGVERALELQGRPLGRILVDEGLASGEAVNRALERQGNRPMDRDTGRAQGSGNAKEAKRDLRVDLGKLDLLLDLVGELVISTGMVFNHPLIRQSGAPDIERAAHHLKGVVAELQNVALGVRMVPVEGPFRKMTRLVHDLSGKSGKKVKLEFRGEETEIDKNVADLIADPLVHMIRNSIDHGLEGPEERIAAGKPETGTIWLEAAQEGGEILISIRDDGRGMNRARILGKAIEKGLIEGDGSEMADSDVFQFIFMPGFSTAEAVTATSGRGVGMDVVKSNLERIGGLISIRSEAGAGSTIVLRIPLTLSIIDGMMVRVGRSMFTVPLLSVKESIRPRKDDLTRMANGQEILMLRGKVLPVVRLHKVHSLAADSERLQDGLLISLESRGAPYCLFVDELVGQRQTVVKALPGFLGKVPGISSCSILDDGEISLILDVAGVYETHMDKEGIV